MAGREIIQHHRGNITVESRLGEGSIFTITLPRGTASLANIRPIEEEEFLDLIEEKDNQQNSNVPIGSAGALTSNFPQVLVADDNSDMREYLQRFLANHYRLYLANDGQEALELAREIHPDLILTDMMMPRMGGVPVLEFLKTIDDAPPVIMITANEGGRHKAYAEMLGVDDYIRKPFAMDRLVEAVTRLLT